VIVFRSRPPLPPLRNRQGLPVKLGTALAKVIAEEAGFPYGNESLSTVLSAARPVLGDAKLLRIYEREYRDIEPAGDLRALSQSRGSVYTRGTLTTG